MLARVRAALADHGLDVTHAFDAGALPDELRLHLAPPRPRAQALLVGNSRALWPVFAAARPAIADAAHPLDRHVEHALGVAVAAAAVPTTVALGHAVGEHGFVPLQRIAAAAGLGRLAPSHLLIHHALGPWLALRAVLVFDVDAAVHDEVPAPPACDCARGCQVALVHAQQARGDDAWRAWLAVRDACPVGRDARYDDAQIAFHYAGVDTLLRRATTRERGPVPTLD